MILTPDKILSSVLAPRSVFTHTLPELGEGDVMYTVELNAGQRSRLVELFSKVEDDPTGAKRFATLLAVAISDAEGKTPNFADEDLRKAVDYFLSWQLELLERVGNEVLRKNGMLPTSIDEAEGN